ncbi:MAG: tRNA (adenine(22)-N(1))-methyltransferase TrmK [Oscillospiraceae bacterium]
MDKLTLSPRLERIASLVPNGAAVADIGTDHGYIPVWLIQNGVAASMIATDINKGPLSRARSISKAYGLYDRITFILCDGLAGLRPNEADTLIIAGMGGETIIGILAAAPWTRRYTRIILQPQSKQLELRKWLIENGYAIDGEHLVRDAGKIYTLFTAIGGHMPGQSLAELYVGAIKNHRSMPMLFEYLDENIIKLEKICLALTCSERPDDHKKHQEYLEIIAGMRNMKERLMNG